MRFDFNFHSAILLIFFVYGFVYATTVVGVFTNHTQGKIVLNKQKISSPNFIKLYSNYAI
jgi:hypothetical protein